MRLPFPRRVETVSLNAYQWFQDTPYRALDQAYRAAIAIQKIETEYFNGNKIESDSAHNRSVTAYFQTKLHQLLRTARWRLAEFRIASAIVSDSDNSLEANNTISNSALAIAPSPEPRTDYDAQQTLAKLTIVDQVLSRYAAPKSSAIELESAQAMTPTTKPLKKNGEISTSSATKTDSIFSKSGVLPRSLLKTGRRINRELKPNTEAEVLREFQLSRYRTKKSVQFLALLIILPLLTQQVSKNLIFSPILNYFQHTDQIEISLNSQLEQEAIEEVEFFEKQLKFEETIGKIPHLTSTQFEEMVEHKTMEIAQVYNQESSNALKNIFSDLLSVGVFVWILMVNSESIQILKSFMDELVYGLSDSANLHYS